MDQCCAKWFRGCACMSDCEDGTPYYIPEHERPLILRSGTPSWGATRCSVNYLLETVELHRAGEHRGTPGTDELDADLLRTIRTFQSCVILPCSSNFQNWSAAKDESLHRWGGNDESAGTVLSMRDLPADDEATKHLGACVRAWGSPVEED